MPRTLLDLYEAGELDHSEDRVIVSPVSQDERFAEMGRLSGRPISLLDAMARQPGCPPSVRFLALLERSGHILDQHCHTYGDDRDSLLTALWRRLHEERGMTP